MDTILLASASPRRREILNQLGYTIHTLTPNIDETPHPKESAQHYVLRMAIEKNHAARRLSSLANHLPLLSADTTVALDNQILGKPDSPEHAAEILRSLSGRTHQVLTAVCLWHNQQEYSIVQQSDVQFTHLSETDIHNYIATGEPMDKAGAYGIQGLGGLFVQHLSGSFTGVMGLPIFETTTLLQQCGLPRFYPASSQNNHVANNA